MAEFTKSEMLDELRTLFLFNAAYIEVAFGKEAAEALMGFRTPTEDAVQCSYLWQDASKVDLDRFPISKDFERAYDFVFSPSGEEIGDIHGRLQAFMRGIPRDLIPSLYERIERTCLTPDGLCQMVADAAHARWKLEEADGPNGLFADASSLTFTTRELGLLANMSEGAVRNALADKSPSGLTAIPGSKPVKVSRDEARRWLVGRRGFRAAPDRWRDPKTVHGRLAAVRTIDDLRTFLTGYLVRFDDLKIWSWPSGDVQVDAWKAGDIPTDRKKIRDFAEAIGLDAPTFVGRVMEAIERRDAASHEER